MVILYKPMVMLFDRFIFSASGPADSIVFPITHRSFFWVKTLSHIGIIFATSYYISSVIFFQIQTL